MASSWKAYNELAWTEDWLANPADGEAEVGTYVRLIREFSAEPPRTLLHMGSGAGAHDRVFKRHFTVTGVDCSSGMLQKARAAHPEIEYLEGDMRTLRLNRQFDAVAIPDSIDYMATVGDFQQAIKNAGDHLKRGGVLLVVGKTSETFQDNNFAYTGERNGVHVTLLENNTTNPYRPNTYEATLVYLIRREGVLTVHTDQHVLGLFTRQTWDDAFRRAGLAMRETALEDLYDKYLLGRGKYPLSVFVGRRL